MKANVNPKNGGPYWTPITPIKGSLFHADSQQLAKSGKIARSELELFERLRAIRNEVVHGPVYKQPVAISLAEVVEYRELVETLIQRIDAITTEAGQGNYIKLDDTPRTPAQGSSVQ